MGTNVTNDGALALAGMPGLEKLQLTGSNVTAKISEDFEDRRKSLLQDSRSEKKKAVYIEFADIPSEPERLGDSKAIE